MAVPLRLVRVLPLRTYSYLRPLLPEPTDHEPVVARVPLEMGQ